MIVDTLRVALPRMAGHYTSKVCIVALVLVMGLCCSSVAAQEEPEVPPAAAPVETPKPATNPKPAAAPAAKPKPAAAKTPAAPKRTGRTDLELSGLLSETTDQFHGRVSLSQRKGPKQWFVRTGYGTTLTRTYTTTKTNTTEVTSFTLDAQYRQDRTNTYNFITAGANVRNRSPYTVVYGDVSGYHMVSAGVGKTLLRGLEGELALANVQRYQQSDGASIQPALTLRLKTPISTAMTLDGESKFIQPLSGSSIVDARLNLTYKFTPTLSMRMTYVANNLRTPVTARSDWDKSFRVALVFSRLEN